MCTQEHESSWRSMRRFSTMLVEINGSTVDPAEEPGYRGAINLDLLEQNSDLEVGKDSRAFAMKVSVLRDLFNGS